MLRRRPLALTLRFGYFFEPSPAPEQTTTLMNLADNDKHGFSFGVGMELFKASKVLPKPIHLDVHVGYIHLTRRRHRKWAPADEVGDFVSSGFLLCAGFQTRLKF